MSEQTESKERSPEEIKAALAKMKAETRKTLAEARKAEADAAAAEHEAEGKLIALKTLRRAEAEEDSLDKHHFIYRFIGEVTTSSANQCISRLTHWHRIDPGCDMTIIFQSPGGSVVPGMALFDFIQEMRHEGHHVTTKAQGYAASMAGILLQAGDERVMDAESWLLIHEAAFMAVGKLGDIEDTVEWIKKVCKRILRIFASRSKLTEAQLAKRWRRTDWWIDADEALKLGLCDRIDGAYLIPEEQA